VPDYFHYVEYHSYLKQHWFQSTCSLNSPPSVPKNKQGLQHKLALLQQVKLHTSCTFKYARSPVHSSNSLVTSSWSPGHWSNSLFTNDRKRGILSTILRY
jgi:hypothetical protein